MDNDLTTLRKMILYLKFSTQPNQQINVKSTVKENNHPIQCFDTEGKECQWRTKIGKDKMNFPEGGQPVLRGIQRDSAGRAFIDVFWKSAWGCGYSFLYLPEV